MVATLELQTTTRPSEHGMEPSGKLNLQLEYNLAQKPMPKRGERIAKIEWFSLYLWDGHHFWLEMDGGEGMTVAKAEIMGLLANIWKRF